jgi:hypothetical protein
MNYIKKYQSFNESHSADLHTDMYVGELSDLSAQEHNAVLEIVLDRNSQGLNEEDGDYVANGWYDLGRTPVQRHAILYNPHTRHVAIVGSHKGGRTGAMVHLFVESN